MIRILSSCAAAALLVTLSACGDFSDRKVCLPEADPSCIPDINEFTVPDLNGPNPNFPDPAAVPSRLHEDLLHANGSAMTIQINEVQLSANADGSVQAVEIAYAGSEELSLEGYTLRTSGQIVDLSEHYLENGVLRVVELGEALNTTAGSLALVNREGRIVDFVQWGAAGQELEAEAVLDGQWIAGEFCALPIAGANLAFFGNYGAGNESANWWAQWPSLGENNPARDGVVPVEDR